MPRKSSYAWCCHIISTMFNGDFVLYGDFFHETQNKVRYADATACFIAAFIYNSFYKTACFCKTALSNKLATTSGNTAFL